MPPFARRLNSLALARSRFVPRQSLLRYRMASTAVVRAPASPVRLFVRVN